MADAGSSALPSFFCPLTLDLMRDPVFTEDGQTFEREPIEQWLALHDTSPVTGARLGRTRLVPNVALRQAIEQWQESHGMHVRRPDIAMDAQPVAVGSFKTVFRGTLRVHMRGEASRNITVAVLKMRRGDCATEVRSFIKLGRHPRLVRFLVDALPLLGVRLCCTSHASQILRTKCSQASNDGLHNSTATTVLRMLTGRLLVRVCATKWRAHPPRAPVALHCGRELQVRRHH